MSGVDDQVLGVVDPAVFGTDSGAALGPQDGAGPTYTELEAGWAVADRPPARWLNWLTRAAGYMHRAALGGAVANWVDLTTAAPGTATTGAALVFHPGIYEPVGSNSQAGTFFAWLSSAGATALSAAHGYVWTAGASLGAFTLSPNAFSRDSARVAWGNGASVYYTSTSSFGTPGSQNTGLSVVGALAIAFREGSDYAVAADEAADVAYNDTNVATAAWTAASTSPSDYGSWDGYGIRSLCYLGGSTYIAVTQGGQVFRSTDGGAVWSFLSTIPGTAADFCNFMARCPHTGAIVALRNNDYPRYSHDNGSTWASASVESALDGYVDQITALKTVGGGAFVAADADGAWFYSVDRGRSWYLWHAPNMDDNEIVRIRAFGCNGQRLIALWENTAPANGVIHSGCLDGRGLPALPGGTLL